MEQIRFMDWQLEVDVAATERAHGARGSGSPESCGCLHCRNLAAARHLVYPREFSQLLGQLGIPEDRESEVYHCGEVEPGLHFYGGWFHFVGRMVGGPECHTGGATGGPVELIDLSERFSVGFTQKTALVPPSFPAGQMGQIEFSAKVPWVLSEPCTG